VMWRGPMLHSVLQQFLQQVAWGELDYMVVDMPPGTGDAQLSLTQLVPLAGAVMVTTPQEISQADVRRAIMMFKKMDVPILGLIENMAHFHCPDNDKKYELFGKAAGEKLAQEYKAPFLGRLPIDPRVAMGGDNGKPVVLDAPDSPVAKQFGEIAAKVAQQVSIAAIQSTSLNVVQ